MTKYVPSLTGFLLGMLLLWAIYMQVRTSKAGRLAELELAKNGGELSDVVCHNAPPGRWDAIVLNTKLDYVFIILYTLSICAMTWTAAVQKHHWNALLLIVLVAILTTAVFDVLENRAILATPGGSTCTFSDADAVRIHTPSRVKWTCFYLALGLLGAGYITIFRHMGLLTGAGGLLILCAAIGAVGLLTCTKLVGGSTAILLLAVPIAMIGTWRLTPG
jgi:hypothetical protein